MKTVFSNAMCAHVWAQLSQPHGRSDSMKFDGAVAYSYAQPVAHIIQRTGRAAVVLFTSKRWSPTTDRHMYEYRSAVRGRESFTVPDIFPDERTRDYQYDHGRNMTHLRGLFHAEVQALMRVPCDSYRVANDRTVDGNGSGSNYRTNAHATLHQLASNAARYAAAFGLTKEELNPLLWRDKADDIIARRDRLASDPKRAAKRAAREAAREATARRVAAEAYERNKEWAAEWLAGTPTVGRHISCPQGGALLRLSPDAGKVQTSWGAEVPVTDAVRVLAFYDRVRGGADPRQFVRAPDAAPVRLGYFQLDAINVDGSIKAGCHIIYAAQIEALRTMIAPGHDGNGSPV